jgi:hypothetical protein
MSRATNDTFQDVDIMCYLCFSTTDDIVPNIFANAKNVLYYNTNIMQLTTTDLVGGLLYFSLFRHSGESRNPVVSTHSGCRIKSGMTI